MIAQLSPERDREIPPGRVAQHSGPGLSEAGASAEAGEARGAPVPSAMRSEPVLPGTGEFSAPLPNGCSPACGARRDPSLIDYPGRLAAVFYTAGCNFRCGFCHNASLLGQRRAGMSWASVRRLCERFREDWVDGAVVTGGEPTLADELPELLRLLASYGFAVKLDTNGSRPDVLERVLPLLDYVAMDIKCGLESYPDVVGFCEPERIAASAALIKRQAADYELRTTVVDLLHPDEELLAVAELVRGAKRYVLQPFLPKDNLPDPVLRKARRTLPERLRHVSELVAGCADELIVRGS